MSALAANDRTSVSRTTGSINVETPTASPSGGGGAPLNQFMHMSAFPDAKFTDVVRPNADTLHSMM